MNSDTRIKRTNKALASSINDEIVMFDAEAGQYYGLNGVASSVWNALEQPKTIDEVCDQLVAEYDIDKETCLREVIQFLPGLIEKGLVEVAD